MIRYKACKPDANQAALVDFIRKLGASFQHTHAIPGALDGIVGYCGIDQRVEIKDPTKPQSQRALTDKEKEVFAHWRGRPPVIIETTDDCLALLDAIKKESV